MSISRTWSLLYAHAWGGTKTDRESQGIDTGNLDEHKEH